jgi:hypothetical protein
MRPFVGRCGGQVCEIVSPGHERKDTVPMPVLLCRHRVTFYWLIWPEDKGLIAHALDGEAWGLATLKGAGRARVPPFEAVALDLGYMLGGE